MKRLCPTVKRRHQRRIEALQERLRDAHDSGDVALQTELEDELGRRIEVLEELSRGPDLGDDA